MLASAAVGAAFAGAMAVIEPTAVISIAVAGGAVLAGLGYAYTSLKKGIGEASETALKLAKDELDLYRDRSERLARDLATLQQRLVDVEAKLAAMANENAVLREVARGDMLVKELSALQDKLDKALTYLSAGQAKEVGKA